MKKINTIAVWVAGLCCAVSGWAAPANAQKNAPDKNAPEKSLPEVARVND